MPGVGSVFGLAFKTPGWFGVFAVMGLTALIPVYGWINLYGWMLTQLDYYRQGRTEMPPAGLHYFSRGVNAFLAVLVWGIPIALLLGLGFIFFFIAIAGSAAASGSSASSSAAGAGAAVGIVIFYAALLLTFPLSLLLQALMPAIIIATERRGFSGGVSPSYVFSIARQNWGNLILAALLIYAGNFLAGLGVYACYVGIIFTLAYGSVVTAGVLRHYEHSLEAQPQVPDIPPAATA